MYKNSKRSVEESLVLVANNVCYVVVDRASFEKTFEMTKVKSFDCQLQISKSTTLLQMSVKFDAVLSLSLCMVLILYLFPGPLPDQSLKKAQIFFSEARKDVQITVLQCHVLIKYFSQRKP